jgi:hypothetical protein
MSSLASWKMMKNMNNLMMVVSLVETGCAQDELM